MIALRASAGAQNPAEIIAPTILSSICATIVAVTVAKLLSKLPKYRQEVGIADVVQDEMETKGGAE